MWVCLLCTRGCNGQERVIWCFMVSSPSLLNVPFDLAPWSCCSASSVVSAVQSVLLSVVFVLGCEMDSSRDVSSVN